MFVLCLLVVQIITECLPISSSGTLQLVSAFFSDQALLVPTCIDTLIELVHAPTVIIVGLYFFKRWKEHIVRLFECKKDTFKLLLLGIIANSCTVGLYIVHHTLVIPFSLWIGFLFTSLLLFSCFFIKNNTNQKYHWSDGLLLGVVQGVALFPGISRFAATYTTARWQGYSRMQSFELSFLLAWPLMLAGSLKGLYTFYFSSCYPELLSWNYLCSIVIASIGAYLLFYLVECIIRRGRIWYFGMYVLLTSIVACLLSL